MRVPGMRTPTPFRDKEGTHPGRISRMRNVITPMRSAVRQQAKPEGNHGNASLLSGCRNLKKRTPARPTANGKATRLRAQRITGWTGQADERLTYPPRKGADVRLVGSARKIEEACEGD